VLAGELGSAEELDAQRIRTALQRYETVMRPYIDRCQDLPQGIDGYLPKSASDIAVNAQVMKWLQRWPFRGFAEKRFFTTADAIELPDYSNSSRLKTSTFMVGLADRIDLSSALLQSSTPRITVELEGAAVTDAMTPRTSCRLSVVADAGHDPNDNSRTVGRGSAAWMSRNSSDRPVSGHVNRA
jgi:hypothetical protein